MVNEEDKVEKTIKTVKDILKDKRAIASKQEEHLSDIRKMMGKEEKGLRRSDRQGTKSQKEQTKRLEYIIEKQNKTNRGEMWKDAKTFGRIDQKLGYMHKLFQKQKYVSGMSVKGSPIGAYTASPNYKSMPLYSQMKNFGKNFRGMITGKDPGEPKDKADKAADAMKGLIKFAVGGSIIGMIGKKLFDSSPLLKAMKSLFDTSIMLIFRPIGDMIGGFLRPILLFFMKNIAVPFYKRFKDMSKFGESQGKKVLGFLLSPQKTIETAIASQLGIYFPPLTDAGKQKLEAAQRYSGIDDWMLRQMMDQEKSQHGETFKYWALNHRRKYSLYGEEGMEKFGMYSKGTVQGMWGSAGGGMGVAKSFDKVKTGWEPQIADMVESAETSGGNMSQVADIFQLMRMSGEFSQSEILMFQEAMAKTKISGFNIVASFEHIEKLFGKVSDDLSRRLNSFKASQLNYFSHRSRNVGDTQKSQDAIDNVNKIFGNTSYGWGQMTGGGLPTTPTGTNVVQSAVRKNTLYNRLNPGGGTQSFYERITNSDGSFKSAGEIEGIAKAMGVSQTDLEAGLGVTISRQGAGILANANKQVQIGNVADPNNKIARSIAEKYEADRMAWIQGGMVGQAPQMGDLTLGGISHKMGGGLITEPVFGIGASGQRYAFGENGAERIMPVGQTNHGGVNHILNINVGNITKEADFEKLKPHIQRWILEANSRRGMI
jgi:hypothetical protein